MRRYRKPECGTPVETYKLILQGKLKSFPRGFFLYDLDRTATKEIVRYFITDIMRYETREDILVKIRKQDFEKNKLSGLITLMYNSSPSRAAIDAFPELNMHLWEFHETMNDYWTGENGKEHGKEAVHWLFYEKLRLRDEDIPGNFSWDIFKKNRLSGAVKRAFNTSLQECAAYCFPGLFPEWALLSHVPNKYWTEERGIYALKWTFEEKLHLKREDIVSLYSRDFMKEQNLYGMVQRCFDSDLYKAIDTIYPGEFMPWEFNVGSGFWTKENATLSMKWLLEKMEKVPGWTIENNLSYKTLKDNGLQSLIELYELTDLLNEVRPGYKTFQLKAYNPNGYWNWKTSKEALQWLIEDKLKITYDEALRLTHNKLRENGMSGILKYFDMPFPKLFKMLFPDKIGKI